LDKEGNNMKIYFSDGSDPMITGSLVELNELAEKLQHFVVSQKTEFVKLASTIESPVPYNALLQALRITKQSSPIKISIEPNHELSVMGSVENLAFWVTHFRFPNTAQDGDHHHPESYSRAGYIQTGSLSTIIEIEEVENDV
jgi:hypothetical protein